MRNHHVLEGVDHSNKQGFPAGHWGRTQYTAVRNGGRSWQSRQRGRSARCNPEHP